MYILDSFYVRPVVCKNPPAEWIYLYLTYAFHSGPLKAKIETSDTGEQGNEG